MANKAKPTKGAFGQSAGQKRTNRKQAAAAKKAATVKEQE